LWVIIEQGDIQATKNKRNTSEHSQYGCIEMLFTVEEEARIRKQEEEG
jgi:hypothetical protein